MKGIIKQVSEMPRFGNFIMVAPYRGNARSEHLCYKDGLLYTADSETGNAVTRIDPASSPILDSAVFLIVVPEFKKVTFQYPWQVERWLCKNPDKTLNAHPKSSSDYSQWCADEGFSALHTSDSSRTRLSISLYHRNRVAWYIKTST